jgi:transcriptional regulator with XRE-family HTH domain
MENLTELKRIIGRNIRSLRNQRKWSQDALGECADLSCKFVGEIERGCVNPSLDSLMKIANALGVEIAELFLTEKLFALSGKDIKDVKDAVNVINAVFGNVRKN